MAKFNKAYSISLKKELTPDEYYIYENKNFKNDLECIICKKFTSYPAKLHLKQRGGNFFATNPNSEHHQDCKHYSRVTDKAVVDIIENDNATEEDILEVYTLIEQKKNHLLKLMYSIKNEEDKPIQEKSNNIKLVKNKKRTQGKRSDKTTKYIEQREIKNISNNGDCFDRPLAVYGKVIAKIITHKNGKYLNKIVKLYYESEIKLSMYIFENIASELKLNDGEYKVFFVGIGKINFKDKKYFNLDFYNKKDFLEFKLITNI